MDPNIIIKVQRDNKKDLLDRELLDTNNADAIVP